MKADPTFETMQAEFEKAMTSDMWTDEQKAEIKKEYEALLEKVDAKK